MVDAEGLAEIVSRLRHIGTDSNEVEVKAAVGGLPKKLVRTVSAFSNGNGGLIILGLDEQNGFMPAEGFDPKAIADAAAGMCADKVTPPARANISIEDVDGSPVVTVEVPALPPRDKPCWVVSQSKYTGSYIRGHDGDRALTPYEIDRLEENRIQPNWDLEVVEAATFDDLDPEIVQSILERERQMHPRVFRKLSDVDAQKALNIIAKDSDGVLRPTLSGLLVAGTYPQQFFPRLNVTFTVYPGTDKSSGGGGRRFVDNLSLVGPIPVLVADTVAAVKRNMRTGGVIEGAFRRDLPDYPPVAVREAVVNALMHRDYSPQARGSQVQVNMYVDRLEVVNPGGLYGIMTVDNLGVAGLSSTRNEHLSSLLEATPYPAAGPGSLSGSGVDGGFVAENRGSGFIEILDQLERELLPPPRPQDSLTTFRLEFERRSPTDAERQASVTGASKTRILDYLASYPSGTSKELAAAAGVSTGGVRRILSEMVAEGAIERTEPLTSPKQRYRLRTQ
ncbi:putative DNA binding domain-containing protein [Corynebacterium sp. 153RC1]|uniref:ATP-binding protein n=1 Tax=unclassified Corynebacterium TaxID=2624378 RepID=UPI00211CD822|nr:MULTISPECIES: ATP-binding protein [unclassified Corynebacterium]MCQ9370835.1 putative DNA binding domain-containing protein [Corynebacterium sp. 35RC1]MCQ9352664.1 putative DNA binding domain-containing protein [Corynebacterium sp. 209RC1]MCQ9354848.1 putative DNA binding domain-containing protein [Corynebacterium sp. 1222RC1]MCQ9357033.1 putative DNA binding domain-containing protein [Corynebacterium sp. 122RC1]MCQ9359279.1 putative DNA binding domain-containing protein [Corynebacterium sp